MDYVIKDGHGSDRIEVRPLRGRVNLYCYEASAMTEMNYTIEKAKKLRKALKKAIRTAEARRAGLTN